MPDSSPRPFVRQYNPDTDFEDLIHVFRETCAESLKDEPIWTIGSYIWARPYLFLEPDTCLVLDNGYGQAVGYIIGTIQTKRLCDRWTSDYLPTVEIELGEESLPDVASAQIDKESLVQRRKVLLDLLRNDPHKLCLGNFGAYLEPYPGHLHIDILPSHQRRGYGKQLIEAFLAAAKAKGCTGVYLGMMASNSSANSFYEACDFHRLPHVLDGGVSGEMGRTSEQIYFVKTL